MLSKNTFPGTLAAAQARLAAVRPAAYARTRNALEGAVTRLSPYLTHGLLTLPQVLASVLARGPLPVQHKFVFELGWRAYFRHVWAHRGDAIGRSLHAGPLPDEAYARELPADLVQARTGIPAIDAAVRTLYDTGYLHNHARMWLASYAVHLRKLHWRTGADWMLGHLLDGDVASNHLSWQWVAGTGSHKPYLFNADNVARFAPPPWHSPGTAIDTSYEALDALARAPRAVLASPRGDGIAPPRLLDAPPAVLGFQPPDAAAGAAVAGREVWLVHPWALGPPPADLAPDAVVVAVAWAEPHARQAWGARRWAFVGERLEALTRHRWAGTAAQVALALRAAGRVRSVDDPHAQPWLPPGTRCEPAADLFPEVGRRCDAFSRWWTQVTRGLHQADQLLKRNQPCPTL